MRNELDRRDFLKYGAASTVAMSSVSHSFGLAPGSPEKPLRLGIHGVGNRLSFAEMTARRRCLMHHR